MAKDWEVIDYQEQYDKGIVKLFNEVFHKNRSADFLHWENQDNPAGKSIIKLAVAGEHVVGHTCLWLFKLKLFEEQVLAGQGIDGMIHPDYRRQGMFEELAYKAFQDAEENGVHVNFRFPNEAALGAVVKKLNVTKVCNIPQYLKVLKGRQAASMFTSKSYISLGLGIAFSGYRLLRGRINTNKSGYDLKYVDHFGQEFDVLWREQSGHYPIAVQRDAAYLNWRYINSPETYKTIAIYKEGRLLGYIVGAIENRKSKDEQDIVFGHIADVFCCQEDTMALRLLLGEMELYMKSQGACAMSCWMMKNWFYAKALEKAGYLNLRSPGILAAGTIGKRYDEIHEKLIKPENWFITIGDSDYI